MVSTMWMLSKTTKGGLQLGYVISKVLDRGIIELVGPYGLATGLSSGSSNVAKLDKGHL